MSCLSDFVNLNAVKNTAKYLILQSIGATPTCNHYIGLRSMPFDDSNLPYPQRYLFALEGYALEWFGGLTSVQQEDFRGACAHLIYSFLAPAIRGAGGQPLSNDDISMIKLYLDKDKWPRIFQYSCYKFRLLLGDDEHLFLCDWAGLCHLVQNTD